MRLPVTIERTASRMDVGAIGLGFGFELRFAAVGEDLGDFSSATVVAGDFERAFAPALRSCCSSSSSRGFQSGSLFAARRARGER